MSTQLEACDTLRKLQSAIFEKCATDWWHTYYFLTWSELVLYNGQAGTDMGWDKENLRVHTLGDHKLSIESCLWTHEMYRNTNHIYYK